MTAEPEVMMNLARAVFDISGESGGRKRGVWIRA